MALLILKSNINLKSGLTFSILEILILLFVNKCAFNSIPKVKISNIGQKSECFSQVANADF